MKKNIKRKFNKNAKITTIKCIRCGETAKTHRSDARYDTHLCCAQDSLERKAKGFKRRALKVSEKVLLEVLSKMQGGVGNNPLGALKQEISKVLTSKDRTNYWMVDTPDFILSYFPTAKVKCFELYLIEEKYLSFQAFVNKKAEGIEHKSKVPRNLNALSPEENAELDKQIKEKRAIAAIRAKDWGFLMLSNLNKNK